MSWIDQAKHDIVIITGDGSEFRPLWKEPQKAKEYNVSQFDFPEVSGSFVSRGTPKGRKFPLEIYFTGDDHLGQSEIFESAADDPRPWTIIHPYYGSINVQPVSINFDNTGDNVSKITISLIETISENNPRITITPIDKINFDISLLNIVASDSFVVRIPKPDAANIERMSSNVTQVYNEGKKAIKDTFNADNYFNLFNDSKAAILNATNAPFAAINATLLVINYPFLFADSVKNRVDTILRQFNILRQTVSTLVTPSDKVIYEKSAAYMIATSAQASITNMDYQSSVDVLANMEKLIDSYNNFVSDIDSVQSDDASDENSYIADHDTMMGIEAVINYTVSNLIAIAVGSKQERSIVLEDDSNVIQLAHRFYGLEPDDSTIDYLIATNNFSLSENIQVKKGRTIKYYV